MQTLEIVARDGAMEAYWDAEDRAGGQTADPDLLAAARNAISVLEPMLAGETDDRHVEVGKTHRYLGDAYSTAAANKPGPLLRSALESYARAEAVLIASGDDVEFAKLQFNFANALFASARRSEAPNALPDRAAVEAAQGRYYKAMKLFQASEPSYVPTVQAMLQRLQVLMQGYGLMDQAREGLEAGEALKRRLEEDPSDVAAISREWRNVPRPSEMLGDVEKLVDAAKVLLDPDSLGEAGERGERQLQEILGKLEKQLATAEHAAESDEAVAFSELFAAIGRARESGEIDETRRGSLDRVLLAFQEAWNLPDRTPEQMLRKREALREAARTMRPFAEKPQRGNT